jgi:hypothetical protein
MPLESELGLHVEAEANDLRVEVLQIGLKKGEPLAPLVVNTVIRSHQQVFARVVTTQGDIVHLADVHQLGAA